MPKRKKDVDFIDEDVPQIENDDIEVVEEQRPNVINDTISKKEAKEIDNDDIPDELQSIIDTCGNDTSYTVGVFRYDTKTQVREKVGTYQIQDFLPDEIAKQYGGGKYEYHIRVNNKIFRRLTTTYATAIVPDKPIIPTLNEIQTMINSTKKTEFSDNTMLEFLRMQQTQMTSILTAIMQNNQNKSNDDSFDKLVKLMTVMGVKNPNNDIDKLLAVFERGLNLSTKVNDLQADEDEDSGLVDKLVKMITKSPVGTELITKLLAGKTVEQQPQIEQTIENPINITTPQPQILSNTISNSDIVKNFLNKHKKRMLIEFNSKTNIDDLADFYYNGILIDDDLINAFSDVFLGDISPIINDISEFQEPNINQYIKSVLEKIKSLLYNSNNDNQEETDNDVLSEENTNNK